MHRHHIIPKHMGGTDDESNLTPPITIQEHAECHRILWEQHGSKYDYIAWKCLSGRITSDQARLMAAKVGQERSEKYKNSRQKAGYLAQQKITKEIRSNGGKEASKKLIQWQKSNSEAFKKQCSKNGKQNSQKNKIPHEYLGVKYESKKAVMQAHNMSICGFYGKLRRGEIIRLPKSK